MGRPSRYAAEGIQRTITPDAVFFRRCEILALGATLPLAEIAGGCTSAPAGLTLGSGSPPDGAAGQAGPGFLPTPLGEAVATPFDEAAAIVQPPLEYPKSAAIARNQTIPLPPGQPSRRTAEIVAATHNNSYEFLPGEGGFAWPRTKEFEVSPWSLSLEGECHRPQTFDLDALWKLGLEERVYAFRCVERWAMNVPWVGFPLRRLLERAQPNSHAKFVRFVSVERPTQMQGIAETRDEFPWPYHEGLRLDEAMNELAWVATGMYGHPLLKQNGAPVRIVLPWKYGFKGPKSIVRIEFTREQPPTFWGTGDYRHEYGFISNINPNIPHPRWSQADSYWLGSDPREIFPTPIFNGYGEWVAALYPDEPRTQQHRLSWRQTAR